MAAKKTIYSEGQIIGQCFFIKEEDSILKKGRLVRYAIFKCKCGELFKAIISNVRRGATKSCGCLVKLNGGEARHGGAVDSLSRINSGYNSWTKIKSRCRTKSCDSYKYYGAKGITMYDEWFNSFESFISYIGPRPSSNHSVDRYPNRTGNYEPGNVRWATPKEQSSNRIVSNYITYNGVTKCLSEWCDLFKINYAAAFYRYKVNKFSIGKIVSRGIINKIYPNMKWNNRLNQPIIN